MADDEIQRLREQLRNEERRRQKAERAQQEAERSQQEAERARQDAERARQEAEQLQQTFEEQLRPLTLFEYLDACHTYLFSGLVPRTLKSSTKGSADNARGKFRPHRIRKWRSFDDEQAEIWDHLLNEENKGFIAQLEFDSLHGMMTIGKKTKKNISSELDLRYFQRDAITEPVGSIIEAFFESERLRHVFGLQGQVTFENHANSLADSEEVEGVRGRPPKLRKGTDGAATPTNVEPSHRPLADEFCIYNAGEKAKKPALVGELKPPHKLPLEAIKKGLRKMDLDEVVERRHDDTENIRHRRLVAAVITQAFSYMIKAGVEYGYISTGEALIFLHFKTDEPGTVYYRLSVPEADMNQEGEDNDTNRLRKTAVGQVLAFTLRAIRTTPHDQNWKDWAMSQLKVWVITEGDLYLPTSEEDEKQDEQPPTPYKPSKSTQMVIRNTPVRTRSRSSRSTCKPTSSQQNSSGEDDEDDESDHDSPSRRPRRSANVMVLIPPPQPPTSDSSYTGPVCRDGTRRYCTQKCLLGLLNGGLLDKACPNVKEHGTEVHQIDHSMFISLLLAQILQKIVSPWTQPLGCESLHRHGARGALFEVILFKYGYTLIGKGFPPEFGKYLRNEQALYNQLRPVQGVHVPVCLGTIDVSKRPMFYDGIADIPHFLLLAHAGTEILKCSVAKDKIISAASESLRAIHALGVLHHDVEPRNLFWSEEGENVLVIDFERAEILRSERAPLGRMSLNRKRKSGNESREEETKVVARESWIDNRLEEELKGMRGYLKRNLRL
ncbi:TPA_exp: Uncharacterized protein A8136_1410 [Trichophyton benhamiae CBS 112371]|uniref:Protein kinase domain-containing protein n=1 Tax=Arthroderma benhamiae (strain ATCC MYA-4681 / CBS 112371) TaxID=663331 RepID=D4AW64_ARTBC|nr:uncharacterized protein ARB_00429 [Trichophyton benhamiae CBS 112371]EFE32604.1 hypothetical protein ARB_00429 [Trichophyton benhamiae CBS 112371]DAA75688.1 TPA_exp: Uncharacterized protein A8136_1410 [Trichophyton benhamiae CBS 112371]